LVNRIVGRIRWHRLRQILASVDVEPQPVQRNCLDQAALQAGIDVKGRRRQQQTVAAIEHRVNLAQRHAVDRDRDSDLDEDTDLGGQVGQAIEAAHLPGRAGIGQAQLGYGIGPGEVAEPAFLLDLLIDVDRVQARKVVIGIGDV
jgi:hypothetical protein